MKKKRLLIIFLIGILMVTITYAVSLFKFSYADWNGQTYKTFSEYEPSNEILDELKEKIISLGISEQYFNEHFVLIFASQEVDINEVMRNNKVIVENRTEVTAYFWIKTNSWVDSFENQGGASSLTQKGTGGYYPTILQAAAIKNPNEEFMVYSVNGFIWHNDDLVSGSGSLNEIGKIIPLEMAFDKLESNLESPHSDPSIKLQFENGLKILLVATDDKNQAILDLETGDVNVKKLEIVAENGTRKNSAMKNMGYLMVILLSIIIFLKVKK